MVSQARTRIDSSEVRELARRCARLADEKRGFDIVILHVLKAFRIAEYFVIVSGFHGRHLKTIADHVASTLKEAGVRPVGSEGFGNERWTLLDYGDVVLHVFSEEARSFYDLELQWGGAPRITWQVDSERGSGEPRRV